MHYLLDKCDEAGIVALVEIPWIHDFADATWGDGTPYDQGNEGYRNGWRYRYQYNVTANAVAMIKELYNHPCVLFYGIGTTLGNGNDIGWFSDQAHTYITTELLPAVRAADPSRLVCIGLPYHVNTDGTYNAEWTDVGDIIMESITSGWSNGGISGVVTEANTWNGRNSTIPMAIQDYSYGANPASHVEWSDVTNARPSDVNSSISVYPEEYQAYCVEQYTGSALALKWPVFNLYGSMFDYAVASINAGGLEHVRQLGLVTRDRSILKDAYYYLKALWNSEPMVYVTQKRNMAKEVGTISLRIYTNCAYVKVYSASMTLLDTIQTSGSHAVTTTTLTLEEGNNSFNVTGHATSSGEATCSDSVTVQYEDTSGTVHVVIYSDNAIVNSGVVAAKVLPVTEPQSVTWSSLDTNVATIDNNGTVTVVADGTASIRATSVDDSSITYVKSIPCFVRSSTASLYSQAAAEALSTWGEYTQDGLTVTNNRNGTTTFNGTLSRSNIKTFYIFPNGYAGGKSAVNSQIGVILVPPWDIPGDQLVTVEVLSGTVTGTHNGTPIKVSALDPTYTTLDQLQIYPFGNVLDGNAVKTKLIPGSTLGISGFKVDLGYENGAVFDDVLLRVQSFKSSSGTYYDGGILESHFDPVNTVHMFGQQGAVTDCNMYARNANGSFTLTVGNPNAGYGLANYGRLTDTFAFSTQSVPLSGATIAEAGDVVKFTAIMMNWPGNYVQKDEYSQFTFKAWYSDGSDAASLRWAFGDRGDGVDFTGGTASTTFIAEKTVDCVGWRFLHFSFGGPLNATEAVTFALKMEILDPSQTPPNSVTAYGSTRIVNTGQLTHACSPVSANQSVTWSSSNTSVATVDSNGKVTVLADGSCTFTATSTIDNSKSGSVTVSCFKITDENMASNVAISAGTSSITVSGVTITNKGDGTFELNGTVSSTASTNYNLGPLATSSNTVFNYFLPITIDGDVLVWFEHLSGTVSEASTLTGKDFEVQVYDLNNSKISDYSLNYQEYPESNGESQCKLITGSTAGIKRFNIASKRPANTVFTNYVIRVGIKKFSQNGLVYSGGVIENYLPAVYSYPTLERLKFGRMPDGSFCMYVTTTGNYWPAQSGCIRLTTSVIYQSSSGDLLTGNAIAPSGKTYKFTLRMLEALSFTAATELSFIVKGVAGTEQAKITVLSNGAQTNALDANGVGEVTFTATEGVDVVYFYYNRVSLSNQKMHFAVSLTEVTS
jgi:uncharacterized protein YjdB